MNDWIYEQLKINNAKSLPKAWNISVDITQKILSQNEVYPTLENDYNNLKEKHKNLKRITSKVFVESCVQENQQEIDKLEKIVNDLKKQLFDILSKKERIQSEIEESKQRKIEHEKQNEIVMSEIDEIQNQIKKIEESILKLSSRIGEQDNTIESLNYMIQAEQKMSKIIEQVKNRYKKVHFSQNSDDKDSDNSAISRRRSVSISSKPNFKISDLHRRAKSFSFSTNSSLSLNSDQVTENYKTMPVTRRGRITTIAFSNNGKYFLCGTEDKNIMHFNFTSNIPMHSYRVEKPITSMDFNSTDSILIVACIDTIQIYDVNFFNFQPRPNKIKIEKIFHTEFVSRNKFIVCSQYHAIRLYKIGKKGPKLKASLAPRIPTIPSWVCHSFESCEFAAGYQTGTIRIWDFNSSHVVFENGVHKSSVIQICFYGSTYISLSLDGYVVVTNALSHTIEKTFYLKGSIVQTNTKMAIYDESILIGGSDGFIYEYSLNDGKFKSKWPAFHSSPITAMSSNKYGVVTGDQNGKIKFWTK